MAILKLILVAMVGSNVQEWRPQASFGNDFKMMVMRVDFTAQVAPELQRQMRTGICQLLPKAIDGTQHQTLVSLALFSYRYRRFKEKPCTDA
ncbi:hypothetical protein TNCV_4362051 [Trichonephila clavipes]|nr:hypothetical protein TNCV_4362051 [Trichonephila clavipes]